MSGWQPIETAPKDGTPLILHYKSIGVAYGFWDHIGTVDWWITQVRPGHTLKWTQWYLNGDEEDPTHWKPLPAGPPIVRDEKDPEGYFAVPRAMSFHVNFRDREGWAGTFSANASWRDDGDYMSIGLGLKEIPLSKAEMRAMMHAMGMAIAARENEDCARDMTDD